MPTAAISAYRVAEHYHCNKSNLQTLPDPIGTPAYMYSL
jgi:hypothetical protein